eukprot:SAG22_NODE_21366_length_257_cov_1.272152_1_plen_35_part_01
MTATQAALRVGGVTDAQPALPDVTTCDQPGGASPI